MNLDLLIIFGIIIVSGIAAFFIKDTGLDEVERVMMLQEEAYSKTNRITNNQYKKIIIFVLCLFILLMLVWYLWHMGFI